MENVITFLISTIVQSIMCSYFIINMAKIFTNKDFSNKKKVLTIMLVLLTVIFSQFLKNTLPLINIFVSILMLYLPLHFLLNVTNIKSFFISILMSAFMAITELITVFLVTGILHCEASYLLNDKYNTLLIIIFSFITG